MDKLDTPPIVTWFSGLFEMTWTNDETRMQPQNIQRTMIFLAIHPILYIFVRTTIPYICFGLHVSTGLASRRRDVYYYHDIDYLLCV